MSKRHIRYALVLVLLIAAVSMLHANERAAAPSVKRGDAPPGGAKTLSVPQARAMLKEAIQKRYVGTTKCCSRVLMVKGCATTVLTAATDVRIRPAGFDLAAPYSEKITAAHGYSNDGKVSVNFKKDQDYIETHRLGLPDTKPRYTAPRTHSTKSAIFQTLNTPWRLGRSSIGQMQSPRKSSPMHSIGFSMLRTKVKSPRSSALPRRHGAKIPPSRR